MKIMINAGPDQKILQSLAKALPSGNTSIDLAIISQRGNKSFWWYNFILSNHYRVGAFLYNGRAAGPQDAAAWNALLQKMTARNIPLITVGARDAIDYGRASVSFLSPDYFFARSAAPSDASLVSYIKISKETMLMVADAGPNVADLVVERLGAIHADIVQGYTFLTAGAKLLNRKVIQVALSMIVTVYRI